MAVMTPQGFGWRDLYCFLQALQNRVFGNPGLAVGTTTTRVKTANAITFSVNGRVYSKAAADPVDDFDGNFANTSAGQTCKVRLEIDSSGNVSGVQGAMASAQALAPMPRRSKDKATLGWIEIPASFTFGTTSYAGATFVNGDPDLADGVGLPPSDRGLAGTVVTS